MIKKIISIISLSLTLFLLVQCEALVSTFDNVEKGVLFKARSRTAPDGPVTAIKAMTWNIRFGAGDTPWFGDSCGDRVILSKKEVVAHLQALANFINESEPDLLIINEIDVESKRTGYINQVQWLLDHTYFNYAAYASVWKAQYIPSDGLGRMDMGNAILSRWKLNDVQRIKLPLRGDQDALTKYFYLRRNILKVRIALTGIKPFYVVATHLSAFSTDDTKFRQVLRLKEILDELNASGVFFIVGGDFNLLPPGSDSTDFCMEDKCPGESFHGPKDKPKHKEGSNFAPEITWLQDMYDNYLPAVALNTFLPNQQHYFTHSPDPNRFWDRKIDYLFTNHKWRADSDSTYQHLKGYSDHVPVSAVWEVPK